MADTYWTYILGNPNGHYYIGHTEDLAARLASHNLPRAGSGKYTHKAGPWKLIWREAHATRALAMGRERQIKSWKSAKMIEQLLQWQSPDGVGINHLVVGST